MSLEPSGVAYPSIPSSPVGGTMKTLHRIRHESRDYYRTGKTGTHRATGQSSAEYADKDDRRVWRMSDGTVEAE